MRIDRNLNFVIPIERETGTVYVHATPVSQDVFKRHFLVISKTFTAIYTEGLSYTSGPRVALLMLEQVARTMGTWDGPGGVAATLVPEIRRLASFVGPQEGSAGHVAVPLQVAVDQKLLDEVELSEVENCVTFFIVASAMHLRSEIEAVLRGAGRLWNASITSLNSTEFAASLQTSTETESGGRPGVTFS